MNQKKPKDLLKIQAYEFKQHFYYFDDRLLDISMSCRENKEEAIHKMDTLFNYSKNFQKKKNIDRNFLERLRKHERREVLRSGITMRKNYTFESKNQVQALLLNPFSGACSILKSTIVDTSQ